MKMSSTYNDWFLSLFNNCYHTRFEYLASNNFRSTHSPPLDHQDRMHDMRTYGTAVLNARHLFRNGRRSSRCSRRVTGKRSPIFSNFVCAWYGRRRKLSVACLARVARWCCPPRLLYGPSSVRGAFSQRYIYLYICNPSLLRAACGHFFPGRHLCAFLTRFSWVSSPVGEHLVLLISICASCRRTYRRRWRGAPVIYYRCATPSTGRSTVVDR